MIDTLLHLLPKAWISRIGDVAERYALETLHRPCNVDAPAMLGQIVETLTGVSQVLQGISPTHPLTRQRIGEFGFSLTNNSRFLLLDPLGYLELLALQRRAPVVITGSGAVQEESTFLGIPCLTLRRNTEQPITVEVGTNDFGGMRYAVSQK